MTKEILESYLEKGNSFGFNIEENSIHTSWVILKKHKPLNKFFERFGKSDNPKLYQEQLSIKNKPYSIWIAKIKTEALNSNLKPASEQYIFNEFHVFKNLDDVEDFLSKKNLNLAEIKWSSEVIFF